MKYFLLIVSIALMLAVMIRGHIDLLLPSVLLVLGGILINTKSFNK
jgi:hypothetical protein